MNPMVMTMNRTPIVIPMIAPVESVAKRTNTPCREATRIHFHPFRFAKRIHSTIGWSHLDNHQMPLSISFSTVTIKSLHRFHFLLLGRMTLLKWAGDLVYLTDFFAYEIRVSYRLKKHSMTHFTYVGLFSFFFGRFFDTCAIFSMWSGHYFT